LGSLLKNISVFKGIAQKRVRVVLGFRKYHSSHPTGHTHNLRKERPMKRLFNTLYIGILTILAALMTASIATASTPLVSANWLADNLDNPELVIIDLRNSIDGGGYETFLEGHIPGAIHSDYGKAGWRVSRDGTPGLLPTDSQFQSLARNLGINDNSQIVIVPAGVSSTDFGSSARAYWTFKVFGHEDVSILNGGWNNWSKTYPNKIEAGAPIAPIEGNFVASFSPEGYIDTDGVEQLVSDKSSPVALLDGRTEAQFWGDGKHPKASAAGHIPGAILISQSNAYNETDNQIKPVEILAEIYDDVTEGPVVSYCNTGHWAATNWFVLSELLGNKNVLLYDGSMVEWTKDQSRPLVSEKSNLTKVKEFLKLG
jgi:thiosulfate/3-mercaptopyruvate sulfurtransferase